MRSSASSSGAPKPRTRTLRLTFLDYQLEVFDCPARHVVYAKGRRAGGTMGAAHRLLELAHTGPPTRHLWVDTVHRNIDKYWRRYFRPRLRGVPHRWSATRKELALASGSVCDFGSAQRPGNLEGFAYDFIWVNEAGIVLRDEALYYHTLLPMTLESPRARLFLIGTPKGPGLFQRLFDRGQDPLRPEWASFRHPSAVNFTLDAAALSALRESLPAHTWRQEVLAEFVASERAVFRDVERIATAAPEPVAQPGVPYVVGVDLARLHDYTVAWVGRADTLAGVHCERFRGVSWRLQVDRIAALAARYGNAPVFADATGLGDAICQALQMRGVGVVGVNLGGSRKAQLIGRLALAIEQEHLRITPHEQTLAELRAYEHHELPSGHVRTAAPGGGHDDCVIALALCHWGMSARSGEFILGPTTVSGEPDL